MECRRCLGCADLYHVCLFYSCHWRVLAGYLGYRWAVILGRWLTLGHASMAVETPLFLYIGIGCLIVGNGLFKLI
jgi:hypothetical protein